MRQFHSDSPWIGEDEVVGGEIIVAITRAELAVLAGGINEALEAIEGWEFETRIGVLPERARVLHDQIGEILRSNYQPE